MTWVQQSTSYSVHCNILGFIYLKRMRAARVILTMENWRGMWLGSIILAQKVWDDSALRTSSFASVLPGVTKTQLKALELKVFTLLNFSTHVKPSLYARAYYDIRTIFKTILTEYEGGVAWRRPLSVKRAKRLFGGADYENAANNDSPRKDLKPLLLPALKGAASRDFAEQGMKGGAYLDSSEYSLTASHSMDSTSGGHYQQSDSLSRHSSLSSQATNSSSNNNLSGGKLPAMMHSASTPLASSVDTTPKPYCPLAYANELAGSMTEDSSDYASLPALSLSKSKRRGRGKSSKLTPLTYEDFTYTKKSPLYVLS